MKTVSESMRETEHKRRNLEESVDSLNEEVAQLRAQGLYNNSS